MTLAYIVRCNFSNPDLEQKWNDWYNGPKLVQMLDKPHFVSVQRFVKDSGEGRDYLAFWILESEQAFETPEYKSDWGFFEWKPYITHWSRDLFRADTGDANLGGIGEGQALRLVSFEGLDEAAAGKARAAVEQKLPGLKWLSIVGLDRHTPLLGMAAVPAGTAPSLGIAGANEAVYRPISPFVLKPRVASRAAG